MTFYTRNRWKACHVEILLLRNIIKVCDIKSSSFFFFKWDVSANWDKIAEFCGSVSHLWALCRAKEEDEVELMLRVSWSWGSHADCGDQRIYNSLCTRSHLATANEVSCGSLIATHTQYVGLQSVFLLFVLSVLLLVIDVGWGRPRDAAMRHAWQIWENGMFLLTMQLTKKCIINYTYMLPQTHTKFINYF
jgi:hypothetical protein